MIASPMSLKPCLAIPTSLLLGILMLSPAFRLYSQGTPPWPRSATMRVEANIHQHPDDPDLGAYLVIPDGGLLPANPALEVVDSSGHALENLIMWHTPADALGIVFRPPASGSKVFVFMRASAGAPPRPRADSTLKPSLFLFTRSGNPSLDNARRMMTEWPPARNAYGAPIDRIGIRWNPYGPDDNFSSWFTGWFKLDKPEKIYFATISDEGSEVHLDGKMLAAWPGRHKRHAGARGQFGKEASLAAGWHRIDYFHFEIDGDQEMCLVWRRGDAKKTDLPGFMEGDAWGRTGSASVERIVTVDGRSASWVSGNLQADGYLWSGNRPVHLHTLVAEGRHDEPARIRWDFGNQAIVENRRANWIVTDSPSVPATATLITTTKAGTLRQTFRLTSFTAPHPHSFDSESDRLLYRRAFLNRIEATATNLNPAASWDPDLWTTLVETLEPYKGGPILIPLFQRGWENIQKLPENQRHLLEERFVEALRLMRDTKSQVDWLGRLEKNERNRERKFYWRREIVKAMLYDAGDTDTARATAARMREQAGSPEEIILSLLSQGDAELFSGKHSQAARYYADAQERARNRSRFEGVAGRPRFESSRPVSARESASRRLPSPLGRAGDLKRGDAWKLYAVNDAAQTSTILAYLEQNAFDEAFAALASWEYDTPMSKIAGDLLMAEARIYYALNDYRRCAAILGAYQQGDAMTSQLASAMRLHLESLMHLKRNDEARRVANEAVERFPGLPVATYAQELLDHELK